MSDKCDVCEGHGIYPIFNRFGKELYSINCPECIGTGKQYETAPKGADYEYPASTAADIKTMDELRERFWR